MRWHVFEGIRHGKQQDVQEDLSLLPRCDLAETSENTAVANRVIVHCTAGGRPKYRRKLKKVEHGGKVMAEWRVALNKNTACDKETMEEWPQTQTRLSISRTPSIRSLWNGMNFSLNLAQSAGGACANYILNLHVLGPFPPSPGRFGPTKSTRSQGAGTVIQSGMLGSPSPPHFSRAVST